MDWFWGYLIGRTAAARQMERQQLAQLSPAERKEYKRAKWEYKMRHNLALLVVTLVLSIVAAVAAKAPALIILGLAMDAFGALVYHHRVKRWPWQGREAWLARQQGQQADAPVQRASGAVPAQTAVTGPRPPPPPEVRNGLAGSMQKRRGVWGPGLASPTELAAALSAPLPHLRSSESDWLLPLGLADGTAIRGRGSVLGWGVPHQARQALVGHAMAEDQGHPVLWVNEGGLVPADAAALAAGRTLVHLDLSRTCTGDHPHAALQAANPDSGACVDFGIAMTSFRYYDGPGSYDGEHFEAVMPLLMAAFWAAGLRGTAVAETAGWVRSGHLDWIVSACAQGRSVEDSPRFVGGTQSLLNAQPDFVTRVTREAGNLLVAVETAEVAAPTGGAAYKLRPLLNDPSLLVVLSLPDRPSWAEYNLASALCAGGDVVPPPIQPLVVCDDLRPPGGIWVSSNSYVWQARPGPGVHGDGRAEQILVGLPLSDPGVREHLRPGLAEADRFAQGEAALLLLSQQAPQPAVVSY